MLCHWELRCYVAVLFVLIYGILEPMYVTGVVSLKTRSYKADVMVHGVENQYVCDGCCVTKKPGLYLAYYLNSSSGEFTSTSSHMCGAKYLPIFLLRDGSLTDENGFFDGSCQIFIFCQQC